MNKGGTALIRPLRHMTYDAEGFLSYRELRLYDKNPPGGSDCGGKGWMSQKRPTAGGESRKRYSFLISQKAA